MQSVIFGDETSSAPLLHRISHDMMYTQCFIAFPWKFIPHRVCHEKDLQAIKISELNKKFIIILRDEKQVKNQHFGQSIKQILNEFI